MDLRAVFLQLSNEEVKRFKAYLKGQSKRSDQKNVELFRLLRDVKVNLKNIPFLLYGRDNRNAYHALRKRLMDAFIQYKSSELVAEEISDELEVTKLLVVAKDFFQQQLYNQGFELLRKAEVKAEEVGSYLLLNEVYHVMIEYNSFFSVDLEEIMSKSEQNLHLLVNEEKLNKIYALMKNYYSDISQPEYKSFEELQGELFAKYQVSEDIRYSYRIVYQLSQMAHVFAIATKDYLSIERLVIKNYNEIKSIPPQTVNEQFYNLQILYIIANIYFRKKSFNESIVTLKDLDQVLKKEKKLEQYFRPLYTCLYSLNLNYLGNHQEAKDILIELSNRKVKYETFAMLDVYLCLVVYEFQQEDFKAAKKRLARFYHTDSWYLKHANIEWVIKKNLIEILTFIELDDYDYVTARIVYFERKYVPYLKETNKSRVIQFFSFIKQVYLKERNPSSAEFKDHVENSFDWKLPVREDIFEISFYAWLKAKMEKQTLYGTTLALVNGATSEV